MPQVRFISCLFVMLFLYSCDSDHKEGATHITKDFNLAWIGDERNQGINLNHHKGEYGGSRLVSETVFAYGFNDNFIIAKTHPNKWTPLYGRLEIYGENYVLLNAKDTALLKEEYLSTEDGKWYLSKEGFEEAQKRLYPDRSVTEYHIIDITNYSFRFFNADKCIFHFSSENDFLEKRKALSIDENLEFSVLFEEFK